MDRRRLTNYEIDLRVGYTETVYREGKPRVLLRIDNQSFLLDAEFEDESGVSALQQAEWMRDLLAIALGNIVP